MPPLGFEPFSVGSSPGAPLETRRATVVVPYGRRPRARRRARRLRRTLLVAALLLVAVFVGLRVVRRNGPSLSPLQQRIVSLAESQVGYRTDPPDSYCNGFSAYWMSGAHTCPTGLLSEEWCADFAAWVWRQAGVSFTYQYINGDINSSSASFYEWGEREGLWHPFGSRYVPKPGDIAVYGLDVATLTAVHVAVVVSVTPGQPAPNVVNGDGDRTGFSVVEAGSDQLYADAGGHHGAQLSGYVSPP